MRHVKDHAHEHPSAEFVDLPFGYVVAISFEEQPAGMCLRIGFGSVAESGAEHGGLRDDI